MLPINTYFKGTNESRELRSLIFILRVSVEYPSFHFYCPIIDLIYFGCILEFLTCYVFLVVYGYLYKPKKLWYLVNKFPKFFSLRVPTACQIDNVKISKRSSETFHQPDFSREAVNRAVKKELGNR